MFTYPKYIITILLYIGLNSTVQAQQTNKSVNDSTENKMNMDAVYDRPFLSAQKMPVAVGGYLEANVIYAGEEGINEGYSFQARRLTMFMSASISRRIKFMSEIEFEEGGKDINIEFAALDATILPIFNFRGGIIMNPIGAFNENHDGPKWEFVERPDVAVNMLPATWSNPGFGIFGKTYKRNWIFGYEAYLSNGFDDSIIDNEEDKTFLPASKQNAARFEESNNGEPLFTGKIAIKNRNLGEIGLSYMGGIFNTYEDDDMQLDDKRRLDVFAVDFNTTIRKTGTYLVGEAAWVNVDVPETYTQQFGNKQFGFFVDVVQPVWRRSFMGWDNATLNLALRVDHVDWNVGTFDQTGTNIGDELWAVTPSISFRPTSQTVFRINYRQQWKRDILNNPYERYAAIMFGFSTYY
ncbi:MAG: hypothetical protein WC967_01620 [Balneolaceae bacterium]